MFHKAVNLLVKLVLRANQSKAVECQVCSAVSGLLTWYRAEVTSGANGSGLLSDLRVFSLARVRLSLDSVVGTVTRYGLEGPGIESRWGRDFPHLSTPTPRLTQSSAKWVPGLSPGQGGRGVVLTPTPI